MTKTNWANVLTWTRLMLIAPITVAAVMRSRIVVAVLFIIAQLTDFFDGIVARKTGVASEKGARFDSQVDNIMVPFLIFWFILLLPQLLQDTYVWLGILLACIALQLIIAKWKLGEWTGLHTWGDKLTAVVATVTVFVLLLFGDVPWTRTVYYVMLTIGIIATLEGIVYLLKGGKNLDARFFWDP